MLRKRGESKLKAWPSDCEHGLNCRMIPMSWSKIMSSPVRMAAATSPSGPILPARRVNRLGALVFFHGGGYVLGNLDNEQLRCIHFANKVNCVVVSPDYRLAPEYPFPAALDDCYRTLCWVAEEGHRLGVDDRRIAVGGISSGGGLAASVAHRARDEKGPASSFNCSCSRRSTPGCAPPP